MNDNNIIDNMMKYLDKVETITFTNLEDNMDLPILNVFNDSYVIGGYFGLADGVGQIPFAIILYKESYKLVTNNFSIDLNSIDEKLHSFHYSEVNDNFKNEFKYYERNHSLTLQLMQASSDGYISTQEKRNAVSRDINNNDKIQKIVYALNLSGSQCGMMEFDFSDVENSILVDKRVGNLNNVESALSNNTIFLSSRGISINDKKTISLMYCWQNENDVMKGDCKPLIIMGTYDFNDTNAKGNRNFCFALDDNGEYQLVGVKHLGKTLNQSNYEEFNKVLNEFNIKIGHSNEFISKLNDPVKQPKVTYSLVKLVNLFNFAKENNINFDSYNFVDNDITISFEANTNKKNFTM